MSALARRKSTRKPVSVDTEMVGKLIRLLASDRDGEVLAAVAALKRTLAAAGLDLHVLAAAAEAGLKPAPRRASWGPPEPSPNDWEALAWFAHRHRHRLRNDLREFVEDVLLGRGFDDGRITEEQLARLRAIVASLRAA